MTAASQTDPVVQYLEGKLSRLSRGQSDASRNAALDILTGRTQIRVAEAEAAIERLQGGEPARETPPTPARTRMRPRLALALAFSAALATLLALGVVRQPPGALTPAVAAVDLPLEPRAETQDDKAPSALPAAPAASESFQDAPVQTVVAGTSEPATSEPATSEPATSEPAATVALPQPSMTLHVLLDEHFASNLRGWPDDPRSTAWLGAGGYRLAAKDPSRFVAIGIPGTEGLRDAVLSASFRKMGGPSGGGYGLILRARDTDSSPLDGREQLGHYYVFEVGDRGEVGIWLRDADRWLDLLTWSASDAVKPGVASNELTVSAIGDHLSFLVNGIPVASQIDSMLDTGAAGIFVGGDGNQVNLEHVTVRVPN